MNKNRKKTRKTEKIKKTAKKGEFTFEKVGELILVLVVVVLIILLIIYLKGRMYNLKDLFLNFLD